MGRKVGGYAMSQDPQNSEHESGEPSYLESGVEQSHDRADNRKKERRSLLLQGKNEMVTKTKDEV